MKNKYYVNKVNKIKKEENRNSFFKPKKWKQKGKEGFSRKWSRPYFSAS